jgi:hypothetical protein
MGGGAGEEPRSRVMAVGPAISSLQIAEGHIDRTPALGQFLKLASGQDSAEFLP